MPVFIFKAVTARKASPNRGPKWFCTIVRIVRLPAQKAQSVIMPKTNNAIRLAA